MTHPPILGAALTLDTYEMNRELMRELPRDVEIQDFINADLLNSGAADAIARSKTVLDGHEGRIGIHGPFWGFALDTVDPDVRTIVKKRLKQALDICAAIRATHMVVHSPFSTWDFNNLDNYERGKERKIELCHLSMGEAVKQAEDIGCMLVIENIEDKDPNDRLKLADSFQSPSVGLSVDTGHAHYAHGSTGAPPVDYFVKLAGNRLHHVHLQDADGYADRHWSLGEGTINWPSVFAALTAATSNPRLIIELRDHSQIRQSIDAMKALGLAQ
ncbi:sugar phosphate isomerase [Roseibium aquae]|uniref:Sugar phosphate isomerase n=1 Tax=Roseibium aquae TaxID=1323746 RepID=A0A916T8K7_9HYPH|nr:sugar phosphate isomerase/epimerase family protein [Roseibium aquae]GGB33295.1 sugar phosphate isomerase [Roseibium aquae]